MALKSKYQFKTEQTLRDARPWTIRFLDGAKEPSSAMLFMTMAVVSMFAHPLTILLSDLTFLICVLYFIWLMTRKVGLPFRLPKSANRVDPNYKRPDGKFGQADGILYLGNDSETGEEIWFTNSDARTHCLYLGTTGAGKTEGLKSYATNALCWASGFIYIDGKADTGLWSTISAQARRFGRDDDLLIMNYMTGNASGRVPSNTLNPFSSGSASYLTNMLTSLMPDSGGDNAMWKERAVSLVSSILPCLVYKREKQNMPLSIGVIRTFLTMKAVIQLARDKNVPAHLREGVQAYLNELPGYVDEAFDDNGDEKPGPDGSIPDTQTPRQQHGYLSMQFTRSMQSLGDDYGFIFDTQAADIDILDVVLQRRILIVLIPALEKSGDETANLGKIISSTLKGMMGATLGNTVEGDTATAIENKPTNSPTPYIAIFDEVGYYTAAGMAVMAAQARSLGFSLVFAGQDLPALEKRVKEEARSITANCNIKLFGKLEDPTQTKDFFEKTVGVATVTEVSGFARMGGGKSYADSNNVTLKQQARATYDSLRGFTEGQAICAFGKNVQEMRVYFSNIGDAKAMRVHRFLPIPPPSEEALESLRSVDSVLTRLRNPKWRADAQPTPPAKDITAMVDGFKLARSAKTGLVESGILAIAAVAEAHGTITPEDATAEPPPVEDKAPEVNIEQEITAAREIHAKTEEAGPMSWMNIIGGDESMLPEQQRVDPPVTEAEAEARATQPQQDDVPSFLQPAEDTSLTQEEPAAPTVSPADQALADKVVQETMGRSPLSWMDIIGADDEADADNNE